MTRDIERDLQILARLRCEVIALASHEDAALWAPAPLMSELVQGTARQVIDMLAARHEHPSHVPTGRRSSTRSAEVAVALANT